MKFYSYYTNPVNLKDICFRSNFYQKMTENMLEIAKHWEDRFEPKSQHHKKNRIVWATQFTKLLQLSNQEKKLKPEAAIVLGCTESLVAFFAMVFSVFLFWIWLINTYCHYINVLVFYFRLI